MGKLAGGEEAVKDTKHYLSSSLVLILRVEWNRIILSLLDGTL